MPPELKARLEASAEELGLSLNAEIVRRLEMTFPADLESQLREVRERELDILKAHANGLYERIAQMRAALRTAPLSEFQKIQSDIAATETLAEEVKFRYKYAMERFLADFIEKDQAVTKSEV